MTGQPGYPGYTAANKQQAPPQYAALANQEQEPSPPMYAIAVEMPVAPVQEKRDFSTGICDCLGNCGTCMQAWCLPWITLAQVSHKIKYTSMNKILSLWLSLSLLWMVTYFGGNHAARNEFRSCFDNQEHADKIADKHLLSFMPTYSTESPVEVEGSGSAEHTTQHHKSHHKPCKKGALGHGHGSGSGSHHGHGSGSGSGSHHGSGSDEAPPSFDAYQCHNAMRILRLQKFVNDIIRMVTWVAFVVIAAGARHKARKHYAFEGSDCNDVCCSLWCNFCVLTQLARELKSTEEGCFVTPTPVSEIAVAPVLSAQVVPVGNQV